MAEETETKTQMPGSRAQTPSAAGASTRGAGARAETEQMEGGKDGDDGRRCGGGPQRPLPVYGGIPTRHTGGR